MKDPYSYLDEKYPLEDKVCKECSKEYVGRSKFCSKSCKHKHNKRISIKKSRMKPKPLSINWNHKTKEERILKFLTSLKEPKFSHSI